MNQKPRKLSAGQAICEGCGLVYYMPKEDKHLAGSRHALGAAKRAMKADGFERAGTWSKCIERAGFEIRYAPVRELGAKRRDEVRTLEQGPWAHRQAVLAARALNHVHIRAEERAKAIHLLAYWPRLRDALNGIKHLGSPEAVVAWVLALCESSNVSDAP